MTTIEEDVVRYFDLCARVPSYHADHKLLYQALRRGDTERIRLSICRGSWLLVCHVLQPCFQAAYGSPYLYRDLDTLELTDVWEPVIKDFVRRGK